MVGMVPASSDIFRETMEHNGTFCGHAFSLFSTCSTVHSFGWNHRGMSARQHCPKNAVKTFFCVSSAWNYLGHDVLMAHGTSDRKPARSTRKRKRDGGCSILYLEKNGVESVRNWVSVRADARMVTWLHFFTDGKKRSESYFTHLEREFFVLCKRESEKEQGKKDRRPRTKVFLGRLSSGEGNVKLVWGLKAHETVKIRSIARAEEPDSCYSWKEKILSTVRIFRRSGS